MIRLDTSNWDWDLIKDVGFNGLAIIFFAIVIFSLLPPKAQEKKKNVSVSAVILAMFCAVLGNPDRIATLKFLGFETQTRELTRTINDAKATVASLRALAVATAVFQVDLLAASGRIGGGGTPERKDEQKAHLLERLKALGLTDDQLADVDRADRDWVMRDYMIALLQPLNTRDDPAKVAAYAKAFGNNEALTPDECQNLLSEFHIDDDKTRELLKDYKYYYDTGKQRRPDVWRNRGDW